MEPLATLQVPASDRPDLALLQQTFAAAYRHADAENRRLEILQLLIALTNAAAGTYFLGGQSAALAAVAHATTDRFGAVPAPVQEDLARAAAAAYRGQRLVKVEPAGARAATILASPLQGHEGPIGAVSLLVYLGTAAAETFATVLQLAVSLAAELELRDARCDDPLALKAIAELLDEIRGKSDVEAASLTIAESLAAASGADHVALGLVTPGKSQSIRLKALSGVTEFDRRSDIVHTLESALGTTAQSAVWRRWRTGSDEDAPDLRAAAGQMHAREIWAAPVISTGSGPMGGIILLFSSPVENAETLRADIRPVLTTVADTLDALRDWFDHLLERRDDTL